MAHPTAALPRMTKTRMTRPVPAAPAAVWIPAVAAALANTVSAAIADSATTWPEKTPKQTRNMTTQRTPARIENPASAATRAAARCLLLLRGCPINPTSVAAM